MRKYLLLALGLIVGSTNFVANGGRGEEPFHPTTQDKKNLFIGAAVALAATTEERLPLEESFAPFPTINFGIFVSIMFRSRERTIIKEALDIVIGPDFYKRICNGLFQIDRKDYTEKHDTLLALTTLQTALLELAQKPFGTKKIMKKFSFEKDGNYYHDNAGFVRLAPKGEDTPEDPRYFEIEVLEDGCGGEVAAQMAQEIQELMDSLEQ